MVMQASHIESLAGLSWRVVAYCFTVALICAGPIQRGAQANGADPCPDGQSELQQAQCWSRAAKAAEQDAATRFADLQSAIKQGDGGAHAASVAKEGAAWGRYVEAHCALFTARYDGGSMQTTAGAICHYRLAKQRDAELKTLLEEWSR